MTITTSFSPTTIYLIIFSVSFVVGAIGGFILGVKMSKPDTDPLNQHEQ